jgi:superfamily II DNA or RNA helicase
MQAHTLRDYQLNARAAILKEFESVNSTLLVVPTGGGKTQIAVSVAEEFLHKGRVMFLCHREELARQAMARFQNMLGITPDLEKAEFTVSKYFGEQSRVVVSTVQTQCARGGRMEKFSPYDFSLLITDESHHATSDTWQRVINYYRQNPTLKVLGMTATPDRSDEEALGKVFESVAFDYEITDAIEHGWLVPVTQRLVTIDGLDFSGMHTTAGDLNGAELQAEMERDQILLGVADATLREVGARKTLAFAASVAQANRLCEIFNRYRGGCAEFICGTTPEDDRTRLVKAFAEGKFQILTNCAVFTEGYDDAAIQAVVMARPTKSRSLYAQMAGRAMRAMPGVVDGPPTAEERRASIAVSGKPECLLLDFVGNSGKHKLVTAADILGGKYTDDVKDRAKRNMRKETTDGAIPSDVVLSLEKAQREMDDEREKKRRALIRANASYRTTNVDPFSIFDIRPLPARGWDVGKALSPAQLAVLTKQIDKKKTGVDVATMPYHQQKQLLNDIFRRFKGNLASFAQLNVIRKRQPDVSPDITRAEANRIISDIAEREGWKKRT